MDRMPAVPSRRRRTLAAGSIGAQLREGPGIRRPEPEYFPQIGHGLWLLGDAEKDRTDVHFAPIGGIFLSQKGENEEKDII